MDRLPTGLRRVRGHHGLSINPSRASSRCRCYCRCRCRCCGVWNDDVPTVAQQSHVYLSNGCRVGLRRRGAAGDVVPGRPLSGCVLLGEQSAQHNDAGPGRVEDGASGRLCAIQVAAVGSWRR
jgi:hypothetical protein